MTAALNGAAVAFHTILVAGLAFAIAGGLSMFFSSYLASRSEMDLLKIDIKRERMEIETEPEEERQELGQLLRKEGYAQREVDVILERLAKDKELWLRTQLSHELRVHMEDLAADPWVRPVSAGVAFFALALIAIVPYWFAVGYVRAMLASLSLSLVALFALASRIFAPSHFNPRSGLESAAIGGLAAAVLYGVGLAISSA